MKKIFLILLTIIGIGCNKNGNVTYEDYIPHLEIMNVELIEFMSDVKSDRSIGDKISLNKKYYKSFYPSMNKDLSNKIDSFFHTNSMFNRILIRKNRIIYEFEPEVGLLTTKFNCIYFDSITSPKLGRGITKVEELEKDWYYVLIEQPSD